MMDFQDPTTTLRIGWDNTYARLPDRFFARVAPTPVVGPRLIRVNDDLARTLGIDPDALRSSDGVAMLAGNLVPPGAEPIAAAYAGHQFGGFSPQLGDGRAILLGEVVGIDGLRRDIQLKGPGRTPFSRGGDGRAALGPVLREYLVSEAMAAMGIPTSRALAAVITGEAVRRETLLPGAVFTRVAASHVRVGTFEFFAARGDTDGVRTLADYVIARHYPDATSYRALLDAIIARHAALVARWLLVGFVHGVMNTDNCAVSGETIDYGPCAFLDAYDPGVVFSSIDEGGRYAYGQQPRMTLWNLTRLAQALLPLFGDDQDAAVASAQEALGAFGPAFEAAYSVGLRRKIGLASEREGDVELAQDLLQRMAENVADFTQTFRALCDAAAEPEADAIVRALFLDGGSYDSWATAWRQRLAFETASPAERTAAMRATNPAVIPRNHLVEAAIDAARDHDDFAPFEALLAATARPFEDQTGFAEPPAVPDPHYRTFCGT